MAMFYAWAKFPRNDTLDVFQGRLIIPLFSEVGNMSINLLWTRPAVHNMPSGNDHFTTNILLLLLFFFFSLFLLIFFFPKMPCSEIPAFQISQENLKEDEQIHFPGRITQRTA